MSFMHYANDDLRPGFNLALEQVLLRRAPAPAFWLWRNASTVVVGRHQDIEAEVDLAEAARRGIPVYRRKTGGGAVFHDLGTIEFSFILKNTEPAHRALDSIIAILRAPALATERNDILAADGRKIAGTAQLSSGGRRLLHGCILWDADLDMLSHLLTPPPSKLLRHGVQSVRSRVANLRGILGSQSSADEFILALRLRASAEFAGTISPIPDSWLAEAESLSNTKQFQPCSTST